MNLYNPVNIKFGKGSRSYLPNMLNKKKFILVCSKNGYNRIKNDLLLSTLLQDIENKIFVDSKVDINILDKIKIDNDIDFIVAVGGGSVIDSAKIIKYYNNSNADIISLPTTSGTGSEVTPYATGWDYVNFKKIGFNNLYSTIAIVDSELTYSLPKSVTISSGLDSINQSFESIWNINNSPITQILATKSIELGIESLERLSKNEDYTARKNMSLSSLLSGICISQTKTSVCHSISYPLTVRYDIPHGIACAFTMAEVFKFNSKKDDGRLLKLTKDVLGNKSNFEDMYVYIRNLCKKLDVFDFVKEKIQTEKNLIKLTSEMYIPERINNNMVKVSKKNIQDIIFQSWNST